MALLSLMWAFVALSLVQGTRANLLDRRSGWTPIQLEQYSSNASDLFSWQVAGLALNSTDLHGLCQYRTSYGLLVSIGLDPPYEACRYNSSIPTASALNVHTAISNTNIFITQLLSAFAPSIYPVFKPGTPPVADPTTPRDLASLTYLCKNLRYRLIDAFGLSSDRIITAVCSAANTTRTPMPAQALAHLNSTALQTYKSAQSSLFVSLFITMASTDAQAAEQCVMLSSPSRAARLSALGFDAATVSGSVCAARMQKQEFAYEYVGYQRALTDVFVAVLMAASDVPGWMRWVCRNVDGGGLGGVILSSDTLLARVCRAAVLAEQV